MWNGLQMVWKVKVIWFNLCPCHWVFIFCSSSIFQFTNTASVFISSSRAGRTALLLLYGNRTKRHVVTKSLSINDSRSSHKAAYQSKLIRGWVSHFCLLSAMESKLEVKACKECLLMSFNEALTHRFININTKSQSHTSCAADVLMLSSSYTPTRHLSWRRTCWHTRDAFRAKEAEWNHTDILVLFYSPHSPYVPHSNPQLHPSVWHLILKNEGNILHLNAHITVLWRHTYFMKILKKSVNFAQK